MTINITAFVPGSSLTGTLAPVAVASASGQVTAGWAVNAGSSPGTLAVSVSRNGAAVQPLIPPRTIAAMGTTALAELNSFPLSSGDTLLASGTGLVLYASGYTVTA